MKKITAFILSLLILSSPAFAGPFGTNSRIQKTNRGLSSGPIPMGLPATGVLDEAVVKLSPGLIYNITLVATSNNATLDVFDSFTNANPTDLINETPIYEVRVATAGNISTIPLDSSPASTVEGIAITVSNGYAFVTYE